MKVKKHQQESLQKDVRLLSILIAVLALLFGLYLVGIGISGTATVITFFAFLLFVSPYILLGSPVIIKVLKTNYPGPKSILMVLETTIIFFVLVHIYALLTKQFTIQFALYSVIWLVLVGAVTFWGPRLKTAHVFNYLLILLLWLPFEFGVLDQITLPAVQSVTNPLMLLGLLILLCVYLVMHDFDIGYTFRLKAEDYRVIILDFIVFFLVALILGMLTKFTSIASHMPSFKELVIQIGFMFFLVALPEELFFRGVLFTLMKKQFKGQKRAVGKAMLISSLLFGTAHANNPIGPSIELNIGAASFPFPWALVLISTVAGLFYCFVFIRTQKVTAAAVFHLLVNWVYFAFFN